MMPVPHGFRDLKAYQMAYRLAMEIFHESKSFSTRRKILVNRSDPQILAERGF